MGVTLSSAVQRFISRARENPARAVAPDELETLEQYLRDDRTDDFVARMAPEAPYTWTSRVELLTSADESQFDEIDNFGSPVTVIGLVPLILALESGKTAPPIEAIDVQINVDAGARNFITAANTQPNSNQPRPQFAPLASVSALVANRLIRIDLGLNDQVAAMGFTYRWAVSSAVRTALNYSNVQVSMGVIYRLRTNSERGRGGGK